MFKIGHGIDYHIFDVKKNDKKLILGGVHVKSDISIKAHSDGDIVIHSIVDSILGALGMDDIGFHFPDSNASYKNMDSKIFLDKTLEMMCENNFSILNLDITIICEKIKINPIRNLMKHKLTELIKNTAINIKATTTEKMDDVGKGLGIECHTVALLIDNAFKDKLKKESNTINQSTIIYK